VYLVVGCFYYLSYIYHSVLTDHHERSRGASWRHVMLFWWRVLFAALFFASLAAALVMFVQHKVHRVIGGLCAKLFSCCPHRSCRMVW
jgi:hypothetical protein